jgi:hypothetical protein
MVAATLDQFVTVKGKSGIFICSLCVMAWNFASSRLVL